MLARLHIRNFALIETLQMDLGQGLNILTGETGAGKSLLLGAIGLILGRRVDYSFIFNPDDKCVVEAEFRHIPARTRAELAAHEDFDLEGDTITLRREASANGKSRAFVNDTPVSLNVLKDVTALLVDLHGQHENQRLLDPEQQIALLDQYAGATDRVKEFARRLAECAALARDIARLEQEERDARQQQDYLLFQLQELKGLTLTDAHEAALEEELSLLQHAEEIREALAFATDSLYDREHAAYNILAEAQARLQGPARINATIHGLSERLTDLREALADLSRDMTRTADALDTDPGTLARLQAESDTLNRLKLKHSLRSAGELGVLRADLEARTARFDSIGGQIAAQRKTLDQAWAQLATQGAEIEQMRIAAAQPLKASVDALLAEVGLEHAEFAVEISRHIAPDGPIALGKDRIRPATNGLNTVEFRIRTNKGMPMGSLSQTASGGEVSRVMLAIKAALAAKAELSVLIFDEIDTGISGATAAKVGRVMQKLAQHYQLIAITHLPQIAGKGSTHFRIYKEVHDGRTQSNVIPLAPQERVVEIARMLSGDNPSPSAIQNAQELLEGATPHSS